MTRCEFKALAAHRRELIRLVLGGGTEPAALRELLDLHAHLERVTPQRAPAAVAREVFAPFNPAQSLGAEAVQA